MRGSVIIWLFLVKSVFSLSLFLISPEIYTDVQHLIGLREAPLSGYLKPHGTTLAVLGLSTVLHFVLSVGPWSRFDFSSVRGNITAFPAGVAMRGTLKTRSYREGFRTRAIILRGARYQLITLEYSRTILIF